MTRLISSILFISLGLGLASQVANNSILNSSYCECDSLKTKEVVTNRSFNRIPQYDTVTFSKPDFYKLDKNINRILWYRDIENIDTTKFTNLWNDYSPFNYHASHNDFLNFYNGKKDIELAFQFGPNLDLWAYHIFVIKKMGCCFLITRSYFRHARFTYKAYSIINADQLDKLYAILDQVNSQPVSDREEFTYSGYFIDNRNNKKFFIDFDKEVEKAKTDNEVQKPKIEIEKLYDFVDKQIKWTKTYSL